jgi:hypothetical protein
VQVIAKKHTDIQKYGIVDMLETTFLCVLSIEQS